MSFIFISIRSSILLIDITMLMFTKQQQFSGTIKEKQLGITKYKEQQTSETLTSLLNLHKEEIKVYFDTEVYSTNTVSHTLSHRNLGWLQKQLEWVLERGTQALDQSKRQAYQQKLNQLSWNLSESLKKIQRERERMRNKMMQMFLVRSRQAHKKNVLASNIKKYKELLVIMKSLRDKSPKNEQEINALKSRLQTSCLFVAPSLIEKSLVNLALKSFNKEIPVIQINNLSNLRIIVCYFFQSKDVNSTLGLSGQQSLYSKFKMYLLLRNFLKLSQQTRSCFNQLCEKKLIIEYQKSLQQNRELEHWKIGSLVQSSAELKKLYRNQSIQIIRDVIQSIVKFKNDLNSLNDQMIASLTEQINKKKKLVSSEGKTVPKNLLTILQSCKNTLPLEKVQQFFDFLQKRWFIVENFQKELDLTFRIDTLRKPLLKLCIRSIISPFLQAFAQITKRFYSKKKERHYHLNRLIYQQIQAWKFLLQDYQPEQIIFNSHLNQIRFKSSLCLQADPETIRPAERLKLQSKQKTQQVTTLAKFCLEFNRCFGGMLLYFANKIDSKLFSQSGKDKKLVREIINAWVLLISSSLSDHLIQQLEPGSMLKQIELLNEQILNSVQEQHRLENELDKLHSRLVTLEQKKKEKKKVKVKQGEHEKIYENVLYLNEKVKNYWKLMQLVNLIGAEQEINKLNENLYYGVCKKIIG